MGRSSRARRSASASSRRGSRSSATRAEELEAALREGLAADACFVSGGLGPTHDDRTVEMVAKALGVGLHVDPALEPQIEDVSRAAAVRLKRDYADFAARRDEAGDDPGRRRLARARRAPRPAS